MILFFFNFLIPDLGLLVMETAFTMLVLWQLLDMKFWLFISVVSQALSYIKMFLTILFICVAAGPKLF